MSEHAKRLAASISDGLITWRLKAAFYAQQLGILNDRGVCDSDWLEKVKAWLIAVHGFRNRQVMDMTPGQIADALGDAWKDSQQPSVQIKSREDEQWTAPISKTEAARRLTSIQNARWRQVEWMFKDDMIEKCEAKNKVRLRIDHLDARTRNKLDRPFESF